jgi:uncharacterized protein (TIGR03435 family)
LRWLPESLASTDPQLSDDASITDSAESSIFVAIQKQLGLKLESKNGFVLTHLTVDHIEKPSGN